MRRTYHGLLAALLTLAPAGANAQGIPALRADPRMRGTVPVPAAERDIPTIVAERWAIVDTADTVLEGAAFDRAGNLMLCDVGRSRVLRLTPERRMTVLLDQPGLKVGGLAVTSDGRLFAAAAGDMKGGSIGTIEPRRTTMRNIVPAAAGYVPNDLAFDRQGGFYFTDFKGGATDFTGGIYHVAAGSGTVTPVVKGLALANGVALSPDGRYLWATEVGRNRLLRIELKGVGQATGIGVRTAYLFIGPAPDSMRVDAAGNVYVAMNGQGRVLVFSPGGIPIGQILLPGRDEGFNLGSNSVALKPGTDELYIVAGGGPVGAGAAVFRVRALAAALPLDLPAPHYGQSR